MIRPHPETDGMTMADISAAISDAEDKLKTAQEDCDEEAVTWFVQEIRQLEAALARRNGTKRERSVEADPIEDMLKAAGISELEQDATMAAVEEAVRNLGSRLAEADDVRRMTVRESAIKKLSHIGINAPGRLIDAAIPRANDNIESKGRPVFLADPEPWRDAVDGAKLLDDIAGLIRRYVVLANESANAAALWVLLCWSKDAFDILVLLGIVSPTKRCGKTTLLEIISHLTPRAVFASNITAASLFRIIEKFSPTLLVDEADTFLGDKRELRGIINSGHRRSSGFVLRTVGDDNEPCHFKTWGPKAIALIGKLPSTIEDRAILIAMTRRAQGETVERFRSSDCEAAAKPLKQKALRWANDYHFALRASDPVVPEQLNDRAADNWRPLFAIANMAGGEWPERAKAAALALSADTDEAEGSALIDLLIELREIFKGRDRIPSADLAEHLGAKTETRWAEWSHGKPITQRQVARLLAPLKIKPGTVRTGTETAKGYHKDGFEDAFSRYIPVLIRHTVTYQENQLVMPETDPSQNGHVTDRKSDLNIEKTKDVTVVTDRKAIFRQRDPWEQLA